MRQFTVAAILAIMTFPAAVWAAEGETVKLHPIPWNVDGKPILGTYISGKDILPELQQIKSAGMNIIFGGEKELDANTPEGKYCAENGIKVLHHLTNHLYHGVKLRDPISPEQTTIPLTRLPIGPQRDSNIIQIDDELIRFESIDDTGLVKCQRGSDGTKTAAHREGTIVFWPELCAEEIERVKNSPNLFGYYVLDDSPGDALSALHAIYAIVQKVDPGKAHPVCAGFGDSGSVINFAPGVCDIMFVYWYPVSTKMYHREQTSQEVQRILTTARSRVPGIPFVGIYQAFDGRPAQTGQGVPTADQLREQVEDFVREGASGEVAYWTGNENLPGWTTLPELKSTVIAAHREILETGGLRVRPETEAMKLSRIQPVGFWEHPLPVLGVVPAWYVIGPFEDTDGKLLDAHFPPDDAVDLNAVYPVINGTAGWRVRTTTCGVLGLSNIYGGQKAGTYVVNYMCCDVTSPTEQQVQMRVCSDDDAIVTLDGVEVYRAAGPRGIDYDKDIVPITLPAGTSRITAKVCNRAGQWGLMMRFTDLEGMPIRGLTFTPDN